jgi:predicted RNA binding protein YcfA (HicA-like mRNA interferase family)
MSPRLPQVKPKQLIRVLERMGFVLRRQTGSHAIFRHPETKNMAVVPNPPQGHKARLALWYFKTGGNKRRKFFSKPLAGKDFSAYRSLEIN